MLDMKRKKCPHKNVQREKHNNNWGHGSIASGLKYRRKSYGLLNKVCMSYD